MFVRRGYSEMSGAIGARPRLPIALCALLFLGAAPGPAQRPTFTDPRDGRAYPLVEIAGMTWFAAHLAYAAPGSFCFADRASACEELGRLYPWDVALQACPAGWHLSTEEEWQRVELHLGMSVAELRATRGRGPDVGDRLKVGGASGLEIALAGWRDPEGDYAEGNGNDRAAALWTATEAGPDTAWHRDVSSARSVVWRSEVDKPYALSVRCVRDDHGSGASLHRRERLDADRPARRDDRVAVPRSP